MQTFSSELTQTQIVCETCPIGVTCLSAVCCFSELTLLKNPTKHIGLVQSGSHHHDLNEN
jgi:hypothetical protein